MTAYGAARALARLVLPLRVRLAVRGARHVPVTGPALLVINHRSLMDAVVSQVACPRPVRAMAKSTQFRRGSMARLLLALGAFPVRRYRVDPQAVRTTLRLLDAGEMVAVYPEGERSWDGRLQPFRLGTLRLLLAADVPVVPCVVSGSYELWPRWSRRIGRGPVTVRFGRPLRFGPHPDRASRDRALPGARRRLLATFHELGAPGASTVRV